MKLAQISDSHLGITTAGELKACFKKMAQEDFDVIVHCGDWCGTLTGWTTIRDTLRLIRRYFPDKPIVATIGNHDYWCVNRKRKVKVTDPYTGQKVWSVKKPDVADYRFNLDNIIAQFKEHNVHFLDKDGVYVHPQFSEVVLIGSSGWYATANPRTNDSRWLPIGLEGDTHRHLLKATEEDLARSEKQLLALPHPWKTLVFVSHFPVVNTGRDYKGAFEEFSWSERIADHYYGTYNCQHFLCGHAHQLHKGPLRYECGPDYRHPAYQIIEV